MEDIKFDTQLEVAKKSLTQDIEAKVVEEQKELLRQEFRLTRKVEKLRNKLVGAEQELGGVMNRLKKMENGEVDEKILKSAMSEFSELETED